MSFFPSVDLRWLETLMGALGRRKALDVVGERIEAHRPVGESDVPIGVLPGDGMLEPILVVSRRIVLAGVSAAGFRAGASGMCDNHRLFCEIGKLQRRDQPDVPQQ